MYVLKPLALGVLLALVSATTGAQPVEERKSVSESIAKVTAKAKRLDTNGDGWLSEEETAKGQKTLGLLYGAVKQKVDANHDGRISVEEYVQAQVAEIKAADTNNDGWITRTEANAQKRKLLGELLIGR